MPNTCEKDNSSGEGLLIRRVYCEVIIPRPVWPAFL
jgi:hypothetical protein